MRVETIEKEIYTYPELSESAKEVAKQWYLDGQEPEIFKFDCEESIATLFSNSDLKVQFSLGYCQGDGFNIYGDLNINDIFDKLDMSNDKIEKIKNLIFDENISLRQNNHYNYSLKSQEDAENIASEIEEEDITSEQHNLIVSFVCKVLDYISEIDKKYERDGYNYFYEISNDVMEEICGNNQYEFTKDGNIY